jgi:hypothetical protein
VLAAEILAIILFHAVKIRQEEKIPAETALSHSIKQAPSSKQILDSKSSSSYMMVNLVK